MHIDLSKGIAAYLGSGLNGVVKIGIAAALTSAVRTLNHSTHKIKNDLLRSVAETEVTAIQQQWGDTLSNGDKRKTVLDRLQKRFPKVPAEVLSSALEAAVSALKGQRPATLTLPASFIPPARAVLATPAAPASPANP